MIKGLFHKLSLVLSQFLNSPVRVLLISFFILFTGIFLDGSLFRLLRLYNDSNTITQGITTLDSDISVIKTKIKHAEDPHFIELQAREKLDMVQEGDLIFVFSEEE